MPEYTIYVDFILKSLDLILASLSCVFLVPSFFVFGNVKDGNHISFSYGPLTLWLIFVKLSWCMVTEPLRDWNSLVTCRQLQGVHLGTGGGLRDMNIPGGRPCIVTCSSECLLSWVWHLFFFFFFFWVKTFYSVGWGSLERFTLPPSGQILGVDRSLRASLTSFNILLGTNFHLSRESGLSCLYTASLETPSVGLSCTGLEAASPMEGLQGPFLVQAKSTVVCFCAVLVIDWFFTFNPLIYLG